MDILGRCGVIEHHYDIDDIFAAEVAVRTSPDLIPGWQPLYIGGEHIFRRAGDAHLKDGLEENVI